MQKVPKTVPVIRFRLSPPQELRLTAIGGLVLVVLLLLDVGPGLPPLYALRIGLSLIYLLFVPGFLLQIALFPERTDLDGVERLTLSITLSIALIPPSALLLDRLPMFNINISSIVILDTVLISALFIAIRYRRWRIPEDQQFILQFDCDLIGWWASQDRFTRVLLIVLVAAFVIAVVALAVIVLIPSPKEYYTEFYILGPGGLAQNFLQTAQVDQPITTLIGISNNEDTKVRYHIEIYHDSRMIGKLGPFELDRGEMLEQPFTFTPSQADPDMLIEFLLFRDNLPEVYRKLHLWITVEEG